MSSEDLSAYRAQHDSIQEEFKKQSSFWGKMEVFPELEWVIDLLSPHPDSEVLDIAAGTGLLSRAIAPRVKRVVASDITPEMLAEGRAAAERDGFQNITFEQGAAEDLPYPEASFDAVVTRFSAHHFQSPEAVFGEMSRVCRPGGKLLVVDLVSPEDGELAARYNELERIRDHTHTRALPSDELRRTVEGAGIRVTDYRSREIEMDLEKWLDGTETDPETRRTILEALNGELEGSTHTGFKPFMRDGEIKFIHTWGVVVGAKE